MNLAESASTAVGPGVVHAIPYIILIVVVGVTGWDPAEADPRPHPGTTSAAAATSTDEDHAVLPAGDLDRTAGRAGPLLRGVQPLSGGPAVVHQPQHLRPRPVRTGAREGKPGGGPSGGATKTLPAAKKADAKAIDAGPSGSAKTDKPPAKGRRPRRRRPRRRHRTDPARARAGPSRRRRRRRPIRRLDHGRRPRGPTRRMRRRRPTRLQPRARKNKKGT